jgi:hypothetical protein
MRRNLWVRVQALQPVASARALALASAASVEPRAQSAVQRAQSAEPQVRRVVRAAA